ncbi:MAG TPA: molybdopterin molybdotransferase MoeA [Clostridia bacterium]|nr:molybdopterin molybdotransferase MoeA [Clostridia bacterium]
MVHEIGEERDRQAGILDDGSKSGVPSGAPGTYASGLPFKVEEIPLLSSVGRVLAEEVIAGDDLPPFDRSTVDGYAVRAADTFGAGESSPSLLYLKGEVGMGEETHLDVNPGEAVKIPTGGMLPEGADSVVMVENTALLDPVTVEIRRPVVPRENVIRRGEDISAGTTLLRRGKRLRPQDVAALAGLGRSVVRVYKKPRVAILSTGDEVIPFWEPLSPGKIRDMNAPGIFSAVVEDGGEPDFLGIAKDDVKDLEDRIRQALNRGYDMILLSGGSSVGSRDVTLSVMRDLGNPGVLAHGLALQPGKPTVLGVSKGVPIVGLPGHPVSAMIVYRQFVRPLLAWIGGESIRLGDEGRKLEAGGEGQEKPFLRLSECYVEARLGRNLHSSPGREEWVRVRLEREGGEWVAVPILGGSAMISTLVKADGLVCIPLFSNGIPAGEIVKVYPY